MDWKQIINKNCKPGKGQKTEWQKIYVHFWGIIDGLNARYI